MNLKKFYINGEWVDPIEPNSIEVINPATEKSLGDVSVGSSLDVDKAVKVACEAFKSYSNTKVSERLELLTNIRNIYKKRFDDISSAIQSEMGAPKKIGEGKSSHSRFIAS